MKKYSVLKEKIYNILSIFFKKAYAIGYRFNPDNTDCCSFSNIPFKVIMPTKNEWYADPFPLEYQGKHYIFAEIMKKENENKGILGYTCIEEDNGNFHEALNEPFHLSYPNIFRYNNSVFMIPETNQAEEIRLYEAVHFPDKWELKAVLMDDICCADTSLFFSEKGIFCESYDQKNQKNRLFSLDLEHNKMTEIDTSNSHFIDRRPGGNFIRYENGIYHTLQNCDRVYGEYLHLAKIDSFDSFGLNEKEIRTIKVSDVKHDGKNASFKRIHTFNKDKDLEVIDFHIYKFF